MTDKQIIIDGVNIKDCKRRIGKDNFCRYYLRKAKECEELKKQIEVIKERLFRKRAPFDYTDCPYYIKMVKLEATLAEIKEIVEKIDDSDGCAYGDYDYDNCSSLEQETVCTYKVKKLTLQKIRESRIQNAR